MSKHANMLIAAALILLFSAIYPVSNLPDSQAALSNWIKDLVIMNRLSDADRLYKNNPARFSNLDLGKGFYDAGMSFYDSGKRMLALKTFRKGSLVFQDSIYKGFCLLYTAKIYYQKNNRESALYYVNRALDKGSTNSPLCSQSERLKRMIRWEYIDSRAGLPDNSISAIEFDGDDIWIGLWTGGICRFTRSSRVLTIYKVRAGGIVSGHVRCIALDNGKVWVGTYEGLFCFDKRTERWSRVMGELGNIPVKQIRLLGGRLYAATQGSGLYRMDDSSRWARIFNRGSQVCDILLSGDNLYIATLDSGLYLHRNGSDLNILSGCSPKSICMHNGMLWVGTHGSGIYVLDSKNNVADHFTASGGLSSDYVESIRDMKGSVFMGTLGGGVMSYNSLSRRWGFINVLNGLPSDDVVNINFESNRIWFGTLSGGIGILLTENFDDI
ncbi:MAG: hypothetical protein ABSG94_02580 [Brevinematales bacterium]